MEIKFLMEQNHLHINELKYDAKRILEELIVGKPAWKIKGLEFLIQLLDPSEIPVKFNTSGTTGSPKEINFSKKQIWKSAKNTCEFFEINSGTQLLLCLPADFVAGRMMIARALFAGAHLNWLEPSLNPLKNISNIDFAAFTPAQVATIIADAGTKKVFEKIGKIIIGGGEISNELEKKLACHPCEGRDSNDIFATYGMTETLTHVAVRKIGDSTFHSIYKEAVFSIDENNCLNIDLPFITREKIKTKDVVELIDEKSFIWKGRLDNVINSGGIKIYAEELEKKLLIACLLKEGSFYISAQQDNIFGQVPVIVMLKELNPVDMAVLLPKINRLLNKHEVVKHVVFLDKFECTETGKIKRSTF